MGDLLSIPAMSSELERVFSQAKLTAFLSRNALSDHVMEILELIRYWYKNNVVSQPRGVPTATAMKRRQRHGYNVINTMVWRRDP